MAWEARMKSVGDMIEARVAVAQDGQHFSWTGQLMMRPDEWRDFADKFGLQEISESLWRCGD